MKYSVVTFGCRVNQADSLQIEDALRRRGAVATTPEAADVVVVNSCSVTASADQGTRQMVRRIARVNPHARVVVTGCYASRRPDEVAALSSAVRVVDNDGKAHVADVIDEWCADRGARVVDDDGPCGSSLVPGVAGRTAFTLRVQTGCDEVCSYCIIPNTRGRGRSRPMADVVADITRAIAAGYKEIVITGVHLGSYGRDAGAGESLTSLVRRLAAFPDDVLFRISSLEPMDCTPEIVDIVAGSPRLAPHFHLPLQHGSDRMLRAMRRPYTAAFYADLIGIIHARMPWASIGSDMIVGFPGERDEDAERSERLLASLPLSHVHVFPYSDRPGTDASVLPGKVDGAAVRERGRRLRAVAADCAAHFRTSQAGTRRRALTVDDGRSAVTDNYLKVALPDQQLRNEWIEVQL
jgi:threonylcarbamoyladenosine tRNA methylthiotransferase MtaB